jgi:hypothetical protein
MERYDPAEHRRVREEMASREEKRGEVARLRDTWTLMPDLRSEWKALEEVTQQGLNRKEELYGKIQDLGSPPEWPVCFSATSGFDIGYTFDICGSDGYGKDLSNDLSCIILEALANLHINQPTPTVRYHARISPDYAFIAAKLEFLTGCGTILDNKFRVRWHIYRLPGKQGLLHHRGGVQRDAGPA